MLRTSSKCISLNCFILFYFFNLVLLSARLSENWRDVDSKLLPNKLVNPKLFKTVLGPYKMRSSCNHPAARMTPLRLSSTIFPNNVDSVKVFFHVSVQILLGFSTFVSLIFVPGIVGFLSTKKYSVGYGSF